MNLLGQEIKKLKELIGNNKIEDFFLYAKELIYEDSILLNELIHAKSRYAQTNQDFHKNIISKSDRDLSLDKIRVQLLELTEKIKARDVGLLSNEMETSKLHESINWLIGKLLDSTYTLKSINSRCDESTDYIKVPVSEENIIIRYKNVNVNQNGVFEVSLIEESKVLEDRESNESFRKTEFCIDLQQLTDIQIIDILFGEDKIDSTAYYGFLEEYIPNYHFGIKLLSYNSQKKFISRNYMQNSEDKYVEGEYSSILLYTGNKELAVRIRGALLFLANNFGAKKELF